MSLFVDDAGNDVAVIEQEPDRMVMGLPEADESSVAPEGMAAWPTFVNEIDEAHRSNQAHVFVLHGNVKDYPTNTGIRQDIGETLSTRYDSYWLADKLRQELEENGSAPGVAMPLIRNITVKYTELDGLIWATTKSFDHFKRILRTDAAFTTAKDEVFSPKGMGVSLLLLHAYFRISAINHSKNQPLRVEMQRRGVTNARRLAISTELHQRPEANLTVIWYDADICFPNGSLATLSGDRAAIAYIRGWSMDGSIAPRNKIILVTDNLKDIQASFFVGASRIRDIRIGRPDMNDRLVYLRSFEDHIRQSQPLVNGKSRTTIDLEEGLTLDSVAHLAAGMTRFHMETMIINSWLKEKPLDKETIAAHKEKSLAAEFGDKLKILRPEHGFDFLGGHECLKRYSWNHIITPLLIGDRNRTTRGVLVTGPPGCQPAGSKVLMVDGSWKNVEDVKVGDWVVSPQHDSSTVHARVTETVVYPDRDIYEVATKGRSVKRYRCADNHIVPYLRLKRPRIAGERQPREYILEERQAQEIQTLGKNAQKVTFTTPAVEFSSKEFALHPYVVGAILGDGSVSRSMDPAFVNADPDVWERMALCGAKFGDVIEKHGCQTRYFVGETSDLLRKSELVGHKADTKSVPAEYKVGSIAQRLELLAGLLDTDGSVDSYSTKSAALAQDFVDLVQSVGGFAFSRPRVTHCKGEPFSSYRIHFAFGEFAPVLSMKHKMRKERDFDWKNPRNRDFSVTKVGKETVYGFVLNSMSEWYVTDDWMVTHNTGKSWWAQCLAAEAKVNFIELDFSKLFGGIVGETEKNVAQVLEAIEVMAPCIVFMDEIESSFSNGRQSSGDSGVQARMFNQVMKWLSDESRQGKIVVAAATNRPDLLDGAFIRAGRFDDILVALPPAAGDNRGRKEVLKALAKKTGTKLHVSLSETENTPDRGLGKMLLSERIWSGAEIEVLLKKASSYAYTRLAEEVQKTAREESWTRGQLAESLLQVGRTSKVIEADWDRAMWAYRPQTREVEQQIDLALQYANNREYVPVEWHSRMDEVRQTREDASATTMQSLAASSGGYDRG